MLVLAGGTIPVGPCKGAKLEGLEGGGGDSNTSRTNMTLLFPKCFTLAEVLVLAGGAIPLAVLFRRWCILY